ncbi:MAG: tetratricopeptide repeat protein [Myxococcaceae bacterium]
MLSSRTTLVCFVALEALIAGAYGNTLSGEFQFDDDTSIVENPAIRNLGEFATSAARHYFTQGRPLTDFTLALNYAAGGLEVRGYHLVNLGVHLTVVLLVFLLTLRTLVLCKVERARALALLVAGAYGLHPLMSQAVSYVVQRAESLSALFYLLSLLLLARGARAGLTPPGALAYGLGMVAFVVGLGTKEVIITLPAAFFLYDLYFHPPRSFLRRCLLAAPLFVIGAAYGITRLRIIETSGDVGASVRGVSAPQYLLTQLRVVATYLRLALWPSGQTLDYDFPLSQSFFEPATFASFVVLLGLLVAAYWLRRRERLASFGILWFFLLLAPTSSVVPVLDVIFEHRAYLATWGIVAAAVMLLHSALAGARFLSPRTRDAVALAGSAVLLASLGATLRQRNEVWRTKFDLWSDVARKAPNKPRAHNNLGNCYALRQDYPAAIGEYQRALQLAPHWLEAQYNLAVILEETGRIDEARSYYLQFAEGAPDGPYTQRKQEIRARFGSPQ